MEKKKAFFDDTEPEIDNPFDPNPMDPAVADSIGPHNVDIETVLVMTSAAVDEDEESERQEDEARGNHEHAWKGSFNRPMKVDENSLDKLTVARMTDHNVRGVDEKAAPREHEPLKKGAA
jgi:hypothetical protein